MPGLLVPQRRKDGSTWGWQYRPDVPRVSVSGKPVKYETPVESAQRHRRATRRRTAARRPDRAAAGHRGREESRCGRLCWPGLRCAARCVVVAWQQQSTAARPPSRTGTTLRSTTGGSCSLSTATSSSRSPSRSRSTSSPAISAAKAQRSIPAPTRPGDGKCGLDDFLGQSHCGRAVDTRPAQPARGHYTAGPSLYPPVTTPQHRNTPGQPVCRPLRCCAASWTGSPTRCAPVASSVRSGSPKPCTWCSPPGCSTSRSQPASRATQRPGSPTPSRRSPGSSRRCLPGVHRNVGAGAGLLAPRSTHTGP